MTVFVVCVVASVVIDLITKILTEGVAADIIRGFIGITSVHNTGVAFSWLSGSGWLLILITSVMTVVAVGAWVWLRPMARRELNKPVIFDLGMGLFIGGAIGNLIDRIFLGYVRDFIEFKFVNFAIFNFADIFLNIGVVLIAVYFFFIYKEKNGKNKS